MESAVISVLLSPRIPIQKSWNPPFCVREDGITNADMLTKYNERLDSPKEYEN